MKDDEDLETRIPPQTGETVPAAEAPSRLPERIGPYRILRKLGEGGMGVVYEAEQESPRRKVAVKVIRGGAFVDEARVRLFRREAETLARLRHPGIATIYESGRTEDGHHFFAMELVQGETLGAYMAKRGSAGSVDEVRFRLALFRRIADAVHYAHQRGVIHRDLKPSNIIVTEESAREDDASGPSGTPSRTRIPEIKILDFGLARITGGDIALTTMATEVGQIKGTLAYMSPEQARGNPEEIDVRTDVYALGVILYEMLAGQRPYDIMRAALAEAVRVICEDPPKSLRQSLRGVRRLDQDIETIVNKALEKDADRRYASAAAFSEDVARYLASQPILARVPSGIYQLKKFAARNKTLVGGIMATFIVLVAGVAVATVFGFREAAQRRLAEQARADLEAVVEFQAGMLNKVDPETVGRRLIADLKKRVGETRRNRRSSEQEIQAAEAGFASAVEGVNSTSLALRLIDEEILGRAAKTIEERFKEQPLIDARLRDTIGETYVSLGLYQPAEAQLKQALEARRKLLGDENPDTLLSMKHLSWLYLKQGRYEDARALAEPGLSLHKRALGANDRETLASAYNLALIYASQSRYDEAERLLRETLAAQRQVLGEEHPDTMNSMEALGVLYREQGRFAAAEKQLKAALDLTRKVFGDGRSETVQSLTNLATVYGLQGRYAESAQLLGESAATTKRLLGEEHPDTLAMMHNLAVVYTRLGRQAEAEAIDLRNLELRRRVLGAEHPATLTTMNNLSILYYNTGRKSEAEKLDREILDIRRRVLGDDHSDTLISMNNLAVLYRETGRYSEAESLFRSALEKRKRVSGFAHPTTNQVRTNLIALYQVQGRTADLEPLIAEKFEAARINAEGEDATAEEINDYAWQLLTVEPQGLRNPRQALKLAQHACEKEAAVGGLNLWNYLDTLALAWQMNGNTAAAVETEKKALALLAPDRPERAGLLRQLAEFEARLAGTKDR